MKKVSKLPFLALALLIFMQTAQAQQHPQYPDYPFHASIPASEWLTLRTSEGCIVLMTNWETTRTEFAERQAKGRYRYSWTGTPCTPDQPITGRGTLSEDRVIESGEAISTRRTGELKDGYWQGDVVISSTMTGRSPTPPRTEQYRGGCMIDRNFYNGAVIGVTPGQSHRICHPRPLPIGYVAPPPNPAGPPLFVPLDAPRRPPQPQPVPTAGGIGTPPRLINDIRAAMATMYPDRAIAENQQGVVKAILTITTDGRVAACRVAVSSGFPLLDSATCMVFQRVGRFAPATDASGNAITAETSKSLRWAF